MRFYHDGLPGLAVSDEILSHPLEGRYLAALLAGASLPRRHS